MTSLPRNLMQSSRLGADLQAQMKFPPRHQPAGPLSAFHTDVVLSVEMTT